MRRRKRGKRQWFRACETLVLLDWDDTILPTSFIAAQGWSVDGDLGPLELEFLDAYAQTAERVLAELRRVGRVVIVTNAETGWVELTCRKFLPRLLPSLAGLELLSARSTYEPLGIASPFVWKEHAFAACASSGGRVKTVLSIGDSFHERDALLLLQRSLADTKQKVRCKSLKMLERPDVLRLTIQHELTLKTVAHLVQLDAPLDLFVYAVDADPTCATDLRFACANGEPCFPVAA